ncbi:MAG: deiodinase-like protein [Acidobacteriota bacterium]
MTYRLLYPLAVLALLLAASGGCFPRSAGPRLAHFATTAPEVGQPAPAFTLPSVDGGEIVLADLLGERPLVIQFGSHSCPVYRYRRHWMRDLIADYRERVGFLLVYTVEAHPQGSKSPYAEGEWNPWINRLTGIRLAQPESLDERISLAKESRQRLGLNRPEVELPFAVDRLDDAVWREWGAASASAFVIDRNGRIASRQVWIDPQEIRRALDGLLAPRTPEPRTRETPDAPATARSAPDGGAGG